MKPEDETSSCSSLSLILALTSRLVNAIQPGLIRKINRIRSPFAWRVRHELLSKECMCCTYQYFSNPILVLQYFHTGTSVFPYWYFSIYILAGTLVFPLQYYFTIPVVPNIPILVRTSVLLHYSRSTQHSHTGTSVFLYWYMYFSTYFSFPIPVL